MTTTYGYDNLDRLRSETHSDTSATISYSYDSDGNAYQVTDGSGTTTTGYDAANQLIADTAPGGPTLTYTYDPAGNLTGAGGDGRTSATVYHYDNVDELDQMVEPNGNIDLFAYNADHQRTDTWDNTGTLVAYDGTGNNIIPPAAFAAHIHNTDNTSDQLTETKTTRASSDANANRVADLSYNYTVANPTGCTGEQPGYLTAIHQASTDQIAGHTTAYCYDPEQRLTTATTASGPTYSYGYDGDGNRTTDAAGTHSFNSADQLTDTGTVYDANGNLTASAANTAIYNSVNQTTTANGTTLGYAGSTQTDRTTVGATTQTNGALGLQIDTTTGATTYYQRDPQGTLISEITPGGEYYYTYDGQSSVIALIDPSGVQRAAYTYDPYGSNATATALNGTLPVNPWRYDSGYLDPTGLYHDGARYYDPSTGRFTQPDAATSPAGNRYAYAGCDPVNNMDPTGTSFTVDGGAPKAALSYNDADHRTSPTGASGFSISGSSPSPNKSGGSFFGHIFHSVMKAIEKQPRRVMLCWRPFRRNRTFCRRGCRSIYWGSFSSSQR